MSVNFSVLGSYMESCRPEAAMGASLASGSAFGPALHSSRFSNGRPRAENQRRPFSSKMRLCTLVWLSQMGSSPQNTEGPLGSLWVVGVLGSEKGCLIFQALFATGSSTGISSVDSSGDP